jgi:putative phosphoesterase
MLVRAPQQFRDGYGADDDGVMRVVVVSDTHAPRFWKACPPGLIPHLNRAELILHAGDVCIPSVLDILAAYAPVRVVQGNNDGPEVAAWGASKTAEFEIDGLPVAMIHDSGQRDGRLARMRRRFPSAALVVFGHSHIPMDVSGGGLRILNPGSPTDKRRQRHGTFATLTITDGVIHRAEIVALD